MLQMCAALDEVEGQEGGIDARLTRLAAALDDRLEDMAATGDAGEPSTVVSAAEPSSQQKQNHNHHCRQLIWRQQS